jgi:MFS family permease
MIFIMASALAPNIGAQLAFRFLAGIFGCPPLTCAGGTIADLWNPLEKTITFPLYAILSFGGPVLAPVIASYIGQTGVLEWQWTFWIILITSGAILVLILLFQPETYSPLLLKWKGKHLRQQTGDPRFRSAMDMEKISLFSRINGALKRQFLITFHEPIILLISLYMTVLYIVLFTFFDGYTYIFTDVYDISQGLTNIIFVAMYVGIAIAGLLVPPIYRWTKRDFTAAAKQKNGADPATDPRALDNVHTQPEIRLWFAMFGAPMIPISLFWMGWTDYVCSLLSFTNRLSSKANIHTGFCLNLVAHCGIELLWLRFHLHFHQLLHVRDRLVRYLCRICTWFHDRVPVPCCRRNDGCRYSVL